MPRTFLAYLALFCLAPTLTRAQQHFPERREGRVLPPAVWTASPIAAVGDVVNVARYGVQRIDQPPPMRSYELDWCEGDFRPVAVIKGELPSPPQKYLWASNGCELWPDNPGLVYSRFKTRVWLLREEGGFLRPTYDSGAVRFLGLFDAWDSGKQIPARQQLGRLLLKPGANSDSLEDFAKYLWDVGDIACDLLGKAECVERIRAIAALGNAALHESACGFLKGQFGADCKARE